VSARTVHLDELTYSPDSGDLFERIRELPAAVLLDSAHPHSAAGRYDIITAQPAPGCQLELPAGADEMRCRAFFEDLGALLRERYAGIQPAAQELPFSGGVLGYVGYDCGNTLHSVSHPGRRNSGQQAAPAQLAAYDWCLIQDHLLRRAVLVTQPTVSPGQRRDLLARLQQPRITPPGDFRLTTAFRSNLEAGEYRRAFDKIQAYIRAGDCYQVNLAQRFSADFEGDPWLAYRQLRTVAAAPFSAYLALPDGGAVMSLSPERFISLHGHHVETSPIKGTRARHTDRRSDQLAAYELRCSEKDRAENLMIVDLLRNDLGRSCVPGSIHVDRLFDVQSFATVHHLVSTISGELRPGAGASELLRDSFPGGSITGAPKRRAMEIIAELEPDTRQVYCGSILYISADGRMDSNIAIRTLLCQQGQIHCWSGGGIVADSQWQLEYQETYDKVGRFLSSLEAMGSQ
jgi:para-aminobenzoate synthetase component 1